MSIDALILDLSANLVPVQRRRAWREAGWLLTLGAIELVLLLGTGLMRPDMRQIITSPYMIWKLGSLAILAVVSCVIAIRSFSPTARPRRDVRRASALALAAIIAGAFFVPTSETGSLLDRLSPVHGMLCALSIIVLSMPMMAMLAVLMQRAAPTHPKTSALVSGIASSTCSALVFAFCCPINDPLYVIVWYAAGCAVVAGAARWLLPKRFNL